MVEHFRNAPITEALIDIRVELPSSASLSQLEQLHAKIQDGYPEKQNRLLWEAVINFEREKAPTGTARHQLNGYLFKSADQKQVAQFRLDGFSFSRLHPYTEWATVYAETKRLWDIYRLACNPVQVTRLATRYINSIVIPSKKFDYDDYFTAAPKIPETLPQLLSHFFTRLVIPFPEKGANAIITQTPFDKPDPVNSTVILDIDVFLEESIRPEDPKIDRIFEILHNLKNDVFFGSIKDRTKELFR